MGLKNGRIDNAAHRDSAAAGVSGGGGHLELAVAGADALKHIVAGITYRDGLLQSHLQQALPLVAAVTHVAVRGAGERLGLGLEAGEYELAVAVAAVGEVLELSQHLPHFLGDAATVGVGQGGVIARHGQLVRALQQITGALQGVFFQAQAAIGQGDVTLVLLVGGNLFLHRQQPRAADRVIGRTHQLVPGAKLQLGPRRFALAVDDGLGALVMDLQGRNTHGYLLTASSRVENSVSAVRITCAEAS